MQNEVHLFVREFEVRAETEGGGERQRERNRQMGRKTYGLTNTDRWQTDKNKCKIINSCLRSGTCRLNMEIMIFVCSSRA